MKDWVSTWMGPLEWDFAEPGAGKHALSPFFRTWGPWLAASLIAGLVSGLAVRGLGMPTEVVTTSQQPVMTVALGLFISVQFRGSRNHDGEFEPLAGLVLRTVTASALFLGACLAVAMPAAGDADSGFLAVPTWLLFTTLLAILSPLDQELTQELAQRELEHLRPVRTQLARSI
ncbi:hypothetical protein ACQBJO_06840 [Janibacter sp. G349]|uniref:hypothetical protein n=1 Tax=Janibacter sp. G349 TaxID=3405424 RepID=UPI003B7AAA8D